VSLPDPISDDPFEVALDGETLAKRTLQGSFVTASVQGAKIGIQLASQLVLARRFLFPEDFGLLAMVGPLSGFILSTGPRGSRTAIGDIRFRQVQKQEAIDCRRIGHYGWKTAVTKKLSGLARQRSNQNPYVVLDARVQNSWFRPA
jgi:hypothetical protein